MKRLSLIFVLSGIVVAANAQVLTQWNFNGASATAVPGGINNPTASIGSGTASLVGGTTASFASGTAGGGSSDPVTSSPPNFAWNTTAYPAQQVGNKSAGVQFRVSTVGQEDVRVSFDVRHSNSASRFLQFQYTADGTTWTDFGDLFEASLGGDRWYNTRTVDLSAVSAVENNANFGFRIVTAFAPGTSAYASSTSNISYGTGGTLRYDMVTVEAVPEPGTIAALALGAAAIAARRRRKQS